MWFFRKPTVEEIKNKAFRYYISRPSEDYLDSKFPKIQSWQIRLWSAEFDGIINQIEKNVEMNKRFDYKSFISEISEANTFLDKKSLDKAGWCASYFAWRQGYERK